MGDGEEQLGEFADANSQRHVTMVERIRQRLGLTTLKYQKLHDLVAAIGLPKERLCTYCWDGAEPCGHCPARSPGTLTPESPSHAG
jgi:amidophosphoribosyltransferase